MHVLPAEHDEHVAFCGPVYEVTSIVGSCSGTLPAMPESCHVRRHKLSKCCLTWLDRKSQQLLLEQQGLTQAIRSASGPLIGSEDQLSDTEELQGPACQARLACEF